MSTVAGASTPRADVVYRCLSTRLYLHQEALECLSATSTPHTGFLALSSAAPRGDNVLYARSLHGYITVRDITRV